MTICVFFTYFSSLLIHQKQQFRLKHPNRRSFLLFQGFFLTFCQFFLHYYLFTFQHDFDKDPICLVPFKVEIDNYLPTPSIFRYKTEAHVCRFLGCTKASIPMPGQIKKTLSFHVAVSAPGLYSYGGLSFQMTQPGQECDDDEFIPLEVNFLVEQ